MTASGLCGLNPKFKVTVSGTSPLGCHSPLIQHMMNPALCCPKTWPSPVSPTPGSHPRGSSPQGHPHSESSLKICVQGAGVCPLGSFHLGPQESRKGPLWSTTPEQLSQGSPPPTQSQGPSQSTRKTHREFLNHTFLILPSSLKPLNIRLPTAPKIMIKILNKVPLVSALEVPAKLHSSM